MVLKAIYAFYSLRKSKKALRQFHRLYRRKAKVLDPNAKKKIQAHLAILQDAILQKNGVDAMEYTRQLKDSAQKFMPRSVWERGITFFGSLGFALGLAVVIRSMWFELYTIPTGSMRPTLKESDYLVVSKTDFGLNVPLNKAHFYFDPDLVKRGSIFVFTSEDLDVVDSDTVYFGLFPGKKQFVKRLIGKPGDTLYFYGGQIYGIDKDGNELKDLRDPKWFQNLEHIPFIHFDGKVSFNDRSVVFSQMNQPIAKLQINSFGQIQGEMIAQKGQNALSHYSDLWGMKNYAMARILTPGQLDQLHPGARNRLAKGIMYLELTHHPSLKEARLVRDEMHRLRPDLGLSVSFIPLQQEHLERIADQMITCRFVVEKGIAHRFGFNGQDPFYAQYFPKLPGVPDGMYEIQNGKAYRVYWGQGKMYQLGGGITKELSSDHPLYNKAPENIQFFYNLGFEFLNQYEPSKSSKAVPSRYAYFREGDLYLLGAPIFRKDDPVLKAFLEREKEEQSLSTSIHPYLPFEDMGAPLTKEGKIDVDFLKKHGLVIPDKMYLALGDNHAMSGDSRQFGFVPEANIRGGVSFLFSPPGSRFGLLPQPAHPHATFPNLFVWGSAILIMAGYSFFRRRRNTASE